MTAVTPSTLGRPPGITLPGDVEELFQVISEGYGDHDLNKIMNCVSDNFLHQGMDRDLFRFSISQSYLLKKVSWMKIALLLFQSDGNRAEIAGFVESNLGVLPASENLLPFIEGSKLVVENGEWKLLGNQSPTTMGLYRSFQQLSVYLCPENLPLYQSLIPDPFEAPKEPLVSVKAANYERLRLPLSPYIMAHVQILTQYKGVQGWYTLTMPENAWLPVEMGKSLGYPKHVADSMSFERSNNGWAVEVANEGENILSLSLNFTQDPSQAGLFERTTSRRPMIFLRKLLPAFKEKPWFLLMPVGGQDAQGEVLLLKGDPQFTGLPGLSESFGRIQLSLKTNQPWAGLFSQEITAKGVFMDFTGELILRHRPID